MSERKRQKATEYFRRRDEDAMRAAARKAWIANHPDVAKGLTPGRPWDKPPEADRTPPWWCVKRMGPHGATHRHVYRHVSRENAEKEAEFLAGAFPGAVYLVLEAVAIYCVGEPEVSLSLVSAAAPAAR
jgi:hypothetical protein